MKTILNIRIPSGKLYQVYPNGDLTVYGVRVSKNWQFLGLAHVKRNEFIPLEKLTPEFLRSFNPCWKNGKPQWVVVDRDHGTIRVCGNAKYHGVSKLWFDELPKRDM
jgi:hypothetical protein